VAEDFVLNVKQISQYPLVPTTALTDVALIQQAGIGGSYASITTPDLVATALANGGDDLQIAPSFGIAWNGCRLWSDGITINVPSLHSVGDIFVAGNALAAQVNVDALFDAILENSVFTFNGRKGNVQLETDDVLRAGGAPIVDAHFGGFNTSPTPWDFRASSDQIATTAWVQMVLEQLLCGGSFVTTFNGRSGDITLTTADVNAAYAVPGPPWPTAPNPAFGDASNRIATTLFVDDSVQDLQDWTQAQLNIITGGGGVAYAPINSPAFTGIPTAPTAAPGDSTGTLATTAFVHNAVVAATTGVASFNTRTGAVALLQADVTGVGGALLASPVFTGAPAAPTVAPGDSSTKLATTAFVAAALTAGAVASFNTRTGVVTLSTADITGAGGAPIASPALTGTPTAPTALQTVNNTQVATTAYVRTAIAAVAAGVASFNGRTGAVTLQAADVSAVGGALLAGPAFTGVPTAPTASVGTSTTQIATTAFVQAALTGAGVASFNGRTGVVTLNTADITSAGGAPLASPVLTGTPLGPTAAVSTATNQLATCAFVMAQIPASAVASFNTRTGAVALTLADVTGVGGAPLASPVLTGTPTAPTPLGTDNSTTLATTAFVKTAITAGAVASFNGRTGAVTLQAADVSAVGGALLAAPAFTGAPTAPTATVGTSTTQLATTQFVAQALAAVGGVTTFNTRSGAVTLSLADVTAAGGAPLNAPALTGIPTAPTAATSTNTTQVATTAFVMAQLGLGNVTSFNTRTGAVTLSAADISGAGGALSSAVPGSGNRVLIGTTTVSSAVASVAFTTGIDGTYDLYELDAINLKTTADDVLCLRVSIDGITWVANANQVNLNFYMTSNVTAAPAGAVTTVATSIQATSAIGTSGFSNNYYRFSRPAVSGGLVVFDWRQSASNGVYYGSNAGSGWVNPGGLLSAIQLFFGAHNITAGTFNLYGIKK
jgi:hypothetical protein